MMLSRAGPSDALSHITATVERLLQNHHNGMRIAVLPQGPAKSPEQLRPMRSAIVQGLFAGLGKDSDAHAVVVILQQALDRGW